ncbi:hypothetical protein CKAH01_00290 [Colletotrichum kahawae]|uniref:Uncharacterized protein n=1 Tax=Colletotrichum kahawae TaxID=34407 RepID=A0AAD9YVN8_COLKA|nr:hypothetical protein CKAH01_00290 [Colletotrichum kahawae]
MGQFDWFRSIGATPEAVAVLNDQPILFTILLIVLVAVILQIVLLWYIHFATLKPEQKKKKEPKKGAAKAKVVPTNTCLRLDYGRDLGLDHRLRGKGDVMAWE